MEIFVSIKMADPRKKADSGVGAIGVSMNNYWYPDAGKWKRAVGGSNDACIGPQSGLWNFHAPELYGAVGQA